MCSNPKKEYVRFRKDGETLLNLISEELKKHNSENPDWSNVGPLLHVRHDLKKLLTDMRLKPDSDETEVSAEIEKEIIGYMNENPMDVPDYSITYIPENDFKITKGYYSRKGIVGFLRKYKSNPDKIQFIADMLEE